MTLKFKPEEKLKCLFKKYMDLGSNRPQQKSPDKNLTDEEWNAPDAYHISDFVNPESEEFNDAFDCQMENFGWIKFKDDWIFNDGCYTNPPRLLGIFVGQEDKLPLILEEFKIYLNDCLCYLKVRITEAIIELRKLGIPGEFLYLSNEWNQLVGNRLFGLSIRPVEWNKPSRLESSSKFGRYITI